MLIVEKGPRISIFQCSISIRLFFTRQSQRSLQICISRFAASVSMDLQSTRPKDSLGGLSLRTSLISLGTSLAFLQCFPQLVVVVGPPSRASPRTLRRRNTPTPPRKVFLLLAGSSSHAISHRRTTFSLLPQSSFVSKEVGNILCLLADVGSLVLLCLVDELELLQSLDNIIIVPDSEEFVKIRLLQIE